MWNVWLRGSVSDQRTETIDEAVDLEGVDGS